jgi:hypothetical protein
MLGLARPSEKPGARILEGTVEAFQDSSLHFVAHAAQSVGQADHLRMLARTSQADSGDILGDRMNSLDHSPVVLPVAVPDPVPQVSPTNAPGPPPAHRRHRARNIIIVIVAVTVMYVVLASLDK